MKVALSLSLPAGDEWDEGDPPPRRHSARQAPRFPFPYLHRLRGRSPSVERLPPADVGWSQPVNLANYAQANGGPWFYHVGAPEVTVTGGRIDYVLAHLDYRARADARRDTELLGSVVECALGRWRAEREAREEEEEAKTSPSDRPGLVEGRQQSPDPHLASSPQLAPRRHRMGAGSGVPAHGGFFGGFPSGKAEVADRQAPSSYDPASTSSRGGRDHRQATEIGQPLPPVDAPVHEDA